MRTENWWVRVKLEQSGMDYLVGIKEKNRMEGGPKFWKRKGSRKKYFSSDETIKNLIHHCDQITKN